MLFEMSYALLWALALIQIPIILFFVQELQRLKRGLNSGAHNHLAHGKPIGERMPDFSAVNLFSGVSVQGRDLLSDRTTVIIFLSSTCKSCREIAKYLARYSAEQLQGLAVICTGSQRSCLVYMECLGRLLPVLRSAETDIGGLFLLAAYPSCVAIDSKGNIAGYNYPDNPQDVETWLPGVLQGWPSSMDLSGNNDLVLDKV